MSLFLVLAQKIEISGQVIEGPLKFDSIGEVVTAVLNLFIFPLSGILLFIMIVMSGFNMLFSGGDPKKLAAAKSRLTYAIFGFVLLAASFFITRLIAYLLRAPTGIL